MPRSTGGCDHQTSTKILAVTTTCGCFIETCNAGQALLVLGWCHPDCNGGQRPGWGVRVRQPPGACEWLLWKEHLRGQPRTALGLVCKSVPVTAGAVLGTRRPKQFPSNPSKTKQRELLACSGEHHSVLEQKFGQPEQPDGRRLSGHRPRHAPGSSWSATTPGRRGGGGAPQSRGKHLPF